MKGDLTTGSMISSGGSMGLAFLGTTLLGVLEVTTLLLFLATAFLAFAFTLFLTTAFLAELLEVFFTAAFFFELLLAFGAGVLFLDVDAFFFAEVVLAFFTFFLTAFFFLTATGMSPDQVFDRRKERKELKINLIGITEGMFTGSHRH
ncbi:MAG: hypothetical protein OEZ51_04075 [Nitrospinota bacterium]|nr:hypothetical protein [Nitrospinota bacterium]